jgi:hypothetical protein
VGLPPDQPSEDQPAPPPAPPDEGDDCPRCGTPYEPGQEYCLECGLRLPVQRGVIPVLATAWRRRFRRYPGDWIWPVLGLLIIAALAAAVGILATTGNGSGAETRAETQASVPLGTGTLPTPTDTSTLPTESVPTTAPEQPPPPPPPTSNTLVEWPADQDGWTVVLSSIPQNAGRAAAVDLGQKALSAGLQDVGILNSSEFTSLHPGYFVVFSGIFKSEADARTALDTAQGSYPQSYVRQITH